jgi:hypothetical protein
MKATMFLKSAFVFAQQPFVIRRKNKKKKRKKKKKKGLEKRRFLGL